MPAYCYYRINEISNPDQFTEYKSGLLNCIDKYHGRFIALGKPVDIKEGQCDAVYHFIIEFDLHRQAEEWYNSKEYAALKHMKKKFMKTDILIFKGL